MTDTSLEDLAALIDLAASPTCEARNCDKRGEDAVAFLVAGCGCRIMIGLACVQKTTRWLHQDPTFFGKWGRCGHAAPSGTRKVDWCRIEPL